MSERRVADFVNAFAFLREKDQSVGYLPEWRKRKPNRFSNIEDSKRRPEQVTPKIMQWQLEDDDPQRDGNTGERKKVI